MWPLCATGKCQVSLKWDCIRSWVSGGWIHRCGVHYWDLARERSWCHYQKSAQFRIYIIFYINLEGNWGPTLHPILTLRVWHWSIVLKAVMEWECFKLGCWDAGGPVIILAFCLPADSLPWLFDLFIGLVIKTPSHLLMLGDFSLMCCALILVKPQSSGPPYSIWVCAAPHVLTDYTIHYCILVANSFLSRI